MNGIESVEGAKFETSEKGGTIKIDKDTSKDIVFHTKKPLKSSAVSLESEDTNYVGIAMIPDIAEGTKPLSEYIV